MTAALAGYRVLELAGLGVVLGLVSGYHAGWLDSVIMRVMDGLLAFPSIVLALAITAAIGPSLRNAMIAIGVIGIPGFARLVRGRCWPCGRRSSSRPPGRLARATGASWSGTSSPARWRWS